MTLKQYYHLRRDDVNAILNHWMQRQADGKVPLTFKKAANTLQQNRRASEENGSDAEMEPGEEAEEDLQDNGDSQAQVDAASQGDGGSNDLAEEAHPGESSVNAAENPSAVGSLLKHYEWSANFSDVIAFTQLS